MMQIVETMWSRISKETLTALVPKIPPSRLQEIIINPVISQLQLIYNEFFTSKQVQLQGIQISQRLIRELEIKKLSETFTRKIHEMQKNESIINNLKQSIKKQTKLVQKEKSSVELIETTGKEMILIQEEEEKLKILNDKLANANMEFQTQKMQNDALKGELQKLIAQSNSVSVDAEMMQNFFYLFTFTSVMLGGILEYVREYSVRNPPTVSSDISFVIFYTDSKALISGHIIPVDVKLHFCDIFMNDLSLFCKDKERIVSKYKSDEKSTNFVVRVEYKSDKTIISTKIEDIKNTKILKFEPFDYNGKMYKCVKMMEQNVEFMTGPFQEYLYDPVKNLQKLNSEHDAAS